MSESNQSKKTFHWVTVIVVCGVVAYLLGFLLLHLYPNLRGSLVQFISRAIVLFFLLLAVILGISHKVMMLRFGGTLNRQRETRIIFLLIMFLLPLTWLFLCTSLPLIYTPPALTPENIAVYNECIEFLKEHDEYENFALVRWGWVSITGDEFYLLRSSSPWEKAREIFTERDIIQMEQLAKKLHKVRCHKFQRYGDIVLFYVTKIPIQKVPDNAQGLWYYPLSFVSAGISYFLPTRPGIIYSLTGENPNKINNGVLKEAKPFIKIIDNWYMSRCLILGGIKSNITTSIPKSLIDRSLRIDGINIEDLTRFD